MADSVFLWLYDDTTLYPDFSEREPKPNCVSCLWSAFIDHGPGAGGAPGLGETESGSARADGRDGAHQITPETMQLLSTHRTNESSAPHRSLGPGRRRRDPPPTLSAPSGSLSRFRGSCGFGRDIMDLASQKLFHQLPWLPSGAVAQAVTG